MRNPLKFPSVWPKTQRMSRSRNHGFTLIELLFMLFLAGVLLSLASPAILSAIDHADFIQCQSHLEMLRRAKSSYVVDHAGFGSPSSTSDLAVFRSYLPQSFEFVCPRSPGVSYVSPYDVYTVTTCPYCESNVPSGAQATVVTP